MPGFNIAAKPQRAYWAALLIEALAFHRHVLFLQYTFPWDFRGVHVVFATFIADAFRRGEFPLWDPYTFCGSPIFANIQTALFYPPVLAATVAGVWLGDGAIPRLLVIAVVAQIVFAGICTYALARRLGVSPAAAWIAGTVYELGCFFAAQAEHAGMMHTASWLPLCWLAVVELRGGLKWRWIAVLAFSLSMSVLAGSPPCAIGVFGSTLGLAVIVAAFRLGRWRLPSQVLLACGWATLIAAIQLIPTMELTRNSVVKYRSEWITSGMIPGALFSLVIPNYWSVFDLSKFHGPTDVTFLYLYSSLLGLALAAGAVLWKPDRWTGAFATLLVVATIAMFGDTIPLGHAVLANLPADLRNSIHPEYTFSNFSLALAVLSGLGANRLLRNTPLRIIAGIVIACDLLMVGSGRPMNTVSLKADPGFTHDSADGDVKVVSRLRALTTMSTPAARFDMRPEIPYVWSNMVPVIAIPTANGCDPLAPERMIQVRLSFAPGPKWGTCYQVVNPSSPVLGLANVRYLLSKDAVADANWKLAAEEGWYKIYENMRVLPRFFFVNRVRRVNGMWEAASLLHAPDFRPAEYAVVEAHGGELEALPHGDSGGRVDVISYAASMVLLKTYSSTASFLVATDAFYPGWDAWIDGRRAPLYITDVAFRGVLVPAGDHRVEMRFVPRILYWSAGISVVAFLVLGIVGIRGRLRTHASA